MLKEIFHDSSENFEITTRKTLVQKTRGMA